MDTVFYHLLSAVSPLVPSLSWLVSEGAHSGVSIYGGDAWLDHPPRELCLAQAAMNYAAPPMAVVAGFEVALQVGIYLITGVGMR